MNVTKQTVKNGRVVSKTYSVGQRINLRGDGTERVGDTVRVYDADPVMLAVVKQIAHIESGGTDLICEITQIGV